MSLEEKRALLEAEIAKLESVVVAFSGGVDSTLLLAVCLKVLGEERVLAVTLESALHPSVERGRAGELAAMLGAPFRLVRFDALADADVVENIGIVTCAGTRSSLVSELTNDTVRSTGVISGIDTHALRVPPSVTVELLNVRVIGGTYETPLSWIFTDPIPMVLVSSADQSKRFVDVSMTTSCPPTARISNRNSSCVDPSMMCAPCIVGGGIAPSCSFAR